MAEQKFAIRFSVEDMEKVRSALRTMGTDGASALRALERGSQQATPALKAVDNAARDVRAEFDAMASRIPIVGGALSALGPVGTAVAAGFAGLGLGLGAILNNSRQAIQAISQLQDRANSLRTNAETLQSLRAAGGLTGVDSGQLDSFLSNLQTNSARTSEGFGRMKAALDRVNPELSKQLGLATSLEERMNLVAQAIQSTTSENDKLNIATAAFGGEGAAMIAMLDESGAAMETWAERARAAGLVLDNEFVAAVDAAGDRIDRARARTEVAAQRFALAMAPIDEWIERSKGDQLRGWAWIAEGQMFRSIEDQSLDYLISEFGKLNERLQTRPNFGNIGEAEKYQRDVLERMRAEIQRRYDAEREATERAEAESRSRAARETLASGDTLYDREQRDARAKARVEAAKAAAEAEKAAAEAARLRAQQEREAIDIRASLGDWTGKLAAEEARLNALVDAGLLSREHANDSLARTRGELDGSTAAFARWKGVLEAVESPLQKAERALAAFNDEVAKFGAGDVNTFAVRWRLAEDIDEARRAAEEATPAFQAVKAARDAIARGALEAMSTEEKLALRQAELNALVGKYGFTLEEAQAALHAYRLELQGSTRDQQENAFELRLTAEVLGSVLDENMNSLEDLGRVAVRVFRQMAIEWVIANQKMAASKSLWDFVASAFSAPFGGGGGASAPIPGADKMGNVGVSHAGSVIGSTPVPTRWVSSDIFVGAPRLHSGGWLRPGERAIIAEDGERMFSRVDNARIVRAIEGGRGGGSPNVALHFHGVETKPDVKQSRGADGSLRLDVYMRKAVADAAAAGALDGAMRDRYNIGRAVSTGV